MTIEYLNIKNITDNSLKKFKCKNIGIENLEYFKRNFDEIYNLRTNCAREHKFHLEFISLKIQLLDFWLRIFYVNTKKDSEKEIKTEHATFGSMLCLCKDKIKHFNGEKLLEKLKDFNQGRINAIHYYVLGREPYDSLIKYIEESTFILKKLMKFVYDNCGTIISNNNSDKDLTLIFEL